MMYLTQSIIKGVSAFIACGRSVIHLNVSTLRNKSLFVNESVISEPGVTGFQCFDGFIYYSTWGNQTFRYSMDSHKKEILSYVQIVPLLKDSVILKKDNEDYVVQTTLRGTYEVSGKYISNRIFLWSDILFSNSESGVIAINITTQSIMWQLEIAEHFQAISEFNEIVRGEILQFIGIFEYTLWTLLNGGRFIGIDLREGTIKYQINNTFSEHIHGSIELYPKGNDGYLSPSDRNFYHLDGERGKIIGESARGIWEIDLTQSSPYLEVWSMDDEYKIYDLNDIGYKTVRLGNELFFLDFVALRWGIIDLSTRKIKWISEKIAEEKILLKEIQAEANNVYLLDSNQTLHVFERTLGDKHQ